jgi:regulator of replication initiation timing
VKDSLFERMVQLENQMDELRQDYGDQRGDLGKGVLRRVDTVAQRLDRRIDSLDNRLLKLERSVQGLRDVLVRIEARQRSRNG